MDKDIFINVRASQLPRLLPGNTPTTWVRTLPTGHGYGSEMDNENAAVYIARQEANRDGWTGLRGLAGPGSAWPTQGNIVLDLLLEKARIIRLEEDVTFNDVVMWALVHGWYEGHIEGYDHGQRDARGLPDTDSADEKRGHIS